MKTPKHTLRWSHKNPSNLQAFFTSIMKYHRHIHFILFILVLVVSGCASTKEKKLETKGFTLSYKDKVSADSSISKVELGHPLKLSETEVRRHLKSLVFEELSLFGKKKPVFLPHDLDRIGRLLTKALQHAPNNKIIHYELETPRGATSGDVFASKKFIHWRFDSIKGMEFSGRSYTSLGNVNWRMVPQSGQKYHAVKKLLGNQAQENWIFAKLHPSSKMKRKARQKSPAPSRNKASSRSLENAEKTSPAKNINPLLEEKLELLKDLHEKNLIDESEYNQKRKELLDNYL
ncbi:MAG: hypothetical protein HOF21_07500 [Nitrospina sp.]|jgi:hypothetical protein|nr:hypothetical protein [Nitrospina sp.]MBT5633573.1 hypothetical protein [Nitrospina sp.]